MLQLQRLFGCCLPLQEEHLPDSELYESRRQLLDRPREPNGGYYKHTMKKSRRPVYGSKKKGFAPASAAIFGINEDGASSAPGPSTRHALADITEAVGNIRIHDDEHDRTIIPNVSGGDKRPPKSKPIYVYPSKAPPEFLEPLATAYLEDVGDYLQVNPWEHIISDKEHTLVKIAEASYAEVYRVTETSPFWNQAPETSILKIMRLESPKDPKSLGCGKAIAVRNVVSEFRILNGLTDIPGFVVFKGAQLVQGTPSPSCVAAWDTYNKLHKGETEFPDPRECSDKALFLVIELADAGIVLEDYKITTVPEAWDILLGTANILATGEELCQFEHRDLHENNICVISTKKTSMFGGANTAPEQRFGFSGMEVTLIDYGLSRTTLQNGEIMYCDLEKDLDIFRGQDQHKQFDAYRRMRGYLFTKERKLHRSAWHGENSRPPNSDEWSAYIPYTNVIWLAYLLDYIKKQMVENGIDKRERKKFDEETKELAVLMNPRTNWADGAFTAATDMMVYVLDKKWMTYSQAGWLDDQGEDQGAQENQATPKGKENERPVPEYYESDEDEAGMKDMESNVYRKEKDVKPYSYNTDDNSGDEQLSINSITSDKRKLPGSGHTHFSDTDNLHTMKSKYKATAMLAEKKSKPKPKPNSKAQAPSLDDTESDAPRLDADTDEDNIQKTESNPDLSRTLRQRHPPRLITPVPTNLSK